MPIETLEHPPPDLLDAVPAFVLALDERGSIVVWNRRLEEVTGLHASEMIGTAGDAWIKEGVQRLPVKGGSARSVRWKSSVVTRADAIQSFTYAVGVDVTDESESQRRAARAERLAAVGMLAAGLAHEVRNPLNSAALQLQLLERRLDKGTLDVALAKNTLGVVKAEIQRLDRLVTDFLEFARPRPVVLSPTDLLTLARDVVELLSEEAKRSKVNIVIDFPPVLELVSLDGKRVRQVLLNLLKNSIEAMADGGTLCLRVTAEASDPYVHLEVEDTGPGFAPDAPVFDAFYTTKPHGTGLGLSIVHRIVSEHGGSIDCHSEPGRTRFAIGLPRDPVALDA